MRRFLLSLPFLILVSHASAADLLDQIQAGNIAVVSVNGTGGSSGSVLQGTLHNLTASEVDLDVHMTNPVYFENGSSSAQNMVATQIYGEDGGYMSDGSRSFISLPANTQLQVMMVAYCADYELDNPSASNNFKVGILPDDLQATARNVAAYEAANAEQDLTVAAQVAIWMAAGETPDSIQEKFPFTDADLRAAREMLR